MICYNPNIVNMTVRVPDDCDVVIAQAAYTNRESGLVANSDYANKFWKDFILIGTFLGDKDENGLVEIVILTENISDTTIRENKMSEEPEEMIGQVSATALEDIDVFLETRTNIIVLNATDSSVKIGKLIAFECELDKALPLVDNKIANNLEWINVSSKE